MPDTNTTNKPPPIVRKRSTTAATTTNKSTVTTTTKTTENNNKYIANTHAVISAAKDKATSVVSSARDWLTPSYSEWTPLSSHLESLSTVMFSPLAAHPVYRSESMVKALQLMQQQQTRQAGSSSASSTSLITTSTFRTDLILHGTKYAWPSSTVLLEADIPEASSPVSLFQGFASAYPSLAKSSTSPRRTRQRRKKMNSNNSSNSNHHTRHQIKDLGNKSITQIISEREKRVRDCDKISMQKVSIFFLLCIKNHESKKKTRFFNFSF